MLAFWAMVLLIQDPSRADITLVVAAEAMHAPVDVPAWEVDLRIGADSLGPDLLPVGVDTVVDADAQGHLYVADGDAGRVLVFDAQGRMLRQIGRTGQGPGEFLALRRFHLLPDGGAIAFENQQEFCRISWFDAQFVYQRAWRETARANRILDWRASPHGTRFAAETVHIDRKTHQLNTRYLITDADLHEQACFLTLRYPEFDTGHVRDPQYWRNYLSAYLALEWRGHKGYFAFAPDGRLYTASGDRYEVTEWDRANHAVRRTVRRIRPDMMDTATHEAAVAELRERILADIPGDLHAIVGTDVVAGAVRDADLPDSKPPIHGLVGTEDGFLVIADPEPADGSSRADFFDREGRYRGSRRHQTFALQRLVFKNGAAYTVARNAEGDNEILRYRLAVSDR